MNPDALGLSTATATLLRAPTGSLSLEVKGSGEGEGPSLDGRWVGQAALEYSLQLQTRDYTQVEADGFVVQSVHSDWNMLKGERTRTISGPLREATLTRATEAPSTIVEWLFNAPTSLHLPDGTRRRYTTSVSRHRDGQDLQSDVRSGEKWTDDHLTIDLGLPSVGRVRFGVISPKDVAGASRIERPGFLEYEAGPDGLPDDRLRIAVRSAFSFLFGCGLGILGTSEFGEDGTLFRLRLSRGFAPGGKSEMPPAQLHRRSRNEVDRELCERFVRAYLARREDYELVRVVWQARNSLSASADMSAGYVGSAFEILRRAHYAQPSNAAATRWLPKDEWKVVQRKLAQVLDDETQRFDVATTHDENAVSALQEHKNGLPRLNEVSGTKLNRQLLDDLGLDHGDAEKAALQARNDAAHGNPMDGSNVRKWLRGSAALRTLVARVLFAVVGVEPYGYVDYGSTGLDYFPIRKLKERQQLRPV